MKIFVKSPDANGKIDGTINANLLQHLPNRCSNVREADLVIIPVSYYSDYRYDPTLENIKKPVVLMDFLEYGASWVEGMDSHQLGKNSANFSNVSGPEWMKLDAFVRDHKPAVYFKRELLERERSEWLNPIEFPCYVPAWQAQTKAEFDARPIEVFMSWGLSHGCRQALHGEMFMKALENGITMISAWNQFEGFDYASHKRVWASIHSPHFTRVDISTIMHNQSRAKISLSLPGNGYRCFRDNEAPVNSVMACWEDGIARSFPWKDGENCIRLVPNREYANLIGVLALSHNSLHDIYLAGLETVDKYRSQRYVAEYILPLIQSCL